MSQRPNFRSKRGVKPKTLTQRWTPPRGKRPPRKKQQQQRQPRIQRAPVAQSTGLLPRRNPRIFNSNRGTRIAHTEEFSTVTTANTSFAVSSYPVNPGVASCFPWLSVIAARYEEYKFHSLHFRYVTTTATSTVGSITMAFDFDALDPAPTSMFVARSYHDRAGGAPWANWTFPLDLRQGDRTPQKMIRVGTPVASSDLKTYDIGALHVCTEGIAAGTYGYLEVSYDVEFFIPQIQDPIGGGVQYTSDNTHLFLTVALADTSALLPYTTSGGSTMTFNQTWEGVLSVDLVGTTITNLTAAIVGGSSLVARVGFLVLVAGTECLAFFRVRAFPGAVLTFTNTSAAAASMGVITASCAYEAVDFDSPHSTSTSTSTSTNTTSRRTPYVEEVSTTLCDSMVEVPSSKTSTVQNKKR